jgi:hypothetical protein
MRMLTGIEIEQVIVVPLLGSVRPSCRQWTIAVLDHSRVSPTFNGFSLNANAGLIADMSEVGPLLKDIAARNGLRYSKEDIADSLDAWCRSKRQEVLDGLRASLLFRGKNGKAGEFLELVADQVSDLDLASFLHWLWITKRRLFRLTVQDHMMLVLQGETGAGKTVWLERLCSPFGDALLNADISIFEDKFAFPVLGTSAILFFDELAKISKVDGDVLKRMISANVYAGRAMHSQKFKGVIVSCSFIGASNHDLTTILQDDTSARRFWQITSKNRKTLKKDWKKIEAFPVLEIWQGIDENAPSPAEPFRDQIFAFQQEELCPSSHFLAWTKGWEPDPNSRVSVTDLMADWTDYVHKHDAKNFWNDKTFGQKLKQAGFEPDRTGHKRIRTYKMRRFNPNNNPVPVTNQNGQAAEVFPPGVTSDALTIDVSTLVNSADLEKAKKGGTVRVLLNGQLQRGYFRDNEFHSTEPF